MQEFLPILLADESRFARRFLRLFYMISNYRDITSPNHDNELMLIFEFEILYDSMDPRRVKILPDQNWDVSDVVGQRRTPMDA